MKKNKWLKLRAVITMCAALGWWGLLYPELVLTPDTVKIYEKDEAGTLTLLPSEWCTNRDLYQKLLTAEPEQITFRSKLLTDLSTFWEAFQNETE